MYVYFFIDVYMFLHCAFTGYWYWKFSGSPQRVVTHGRILQRVSRLRALAEPQNAGREPKDPERGRTDTREELPGRRFHRSENGGGGKYTSLPFCKP